jgi:gluconolactonase
MNRINAALLIGSIVFLAGCSKSTAPATGTSPQTPSLYIVRSDPALDAVIAPGTSIEKVATGFKGTEGPMWHDGRLWFSDLVGNKMYAVSPDGKVTLLLDNSGGLKNVPANSYLGSNAMAQDKNGAVLMCQHGLRRIVRLDSKMKPTVVVDKFHGKRLNSPNDLVFGCDGSLWFTDPPYGLLGQDKDPAKEMAFNGVFRLAGGKLTAPIQDLARPNGIGFSPDCKTLYVSNSGPKMFLNKYDLHPDGSVSNPVTLISYPDQPDNEVPDGLKIDSVGNIWSTGPGGIRIITPTGKVLGQLKIPEVAANIAWADAGQTAYITATTSVYRLKVTTPGKMPIYSK